MIRTAKGHAQTLDVGTEFQACAACWIWLITGAKLSLPLKLEGPLSVTKNVTVWLGSTVISNFSGTAL